MKRLRVGLLLAMGFSIAIPAVVVPSADASWKGRNGYLVASSWPNWKSFAMKRGTRAHRLAGIPSQRVANTMSPVAGPGGRFTFERQKYVDFNYQSGFVSDVYVRSPNGKSAPIYNPHSLNDCVGGGNQFAAGWLDSRTVVVSDERRFNCLPEGGSVPSDITATVDTRSGALGSMGTPPGLASRISGIGEKDVRLEKAQGPVAIYRTHPAWLKSDMQIGTLVRRTGSGGSTKVTRLRHASGVQQYLDISPDGRSAVVGMSININRLEAKGGLAILALRADAHPHWIYRNGHGYLAGAAWAPNGHSVAYVTGDGSLYSYQLKRKRTVLVKRHLFRQDEMASASGFSIAWLTAKAK